MANGIILNEKVPTGLLTSDFDYDLPEELIAQSPAERRDGSRLMVLDRKKDAPEHHVFSEIVDFLRPEDILVVNSSKVIPARLLGVTEKSGGTMELLLLKKVAEGRWDQIRPVHERTDPAQFRDEAGRRPDGSHAEDGKDREAVQ